MASLADESDPVGAERPRCRGPSSEKAAAAGLGPHLAEESEWSGAPIFGIARRAAQFTEACARRCWRRPRRGSIAGPAAGTSVNGPWAVVKFG